MTQQHFSLHRDAYGRLVFRSAGAAEAQVVVPVRAFPISAPLEGISLVGSDGRELAWIAHLDRLKAPARELIQAELAQREFMPRLRRLLRVSSFSTPSTWSVETDRGATSFVLKGEEDIRRLPGNALLITSGQGLVFSVPDRTALDRASKRLLERFL